MIVTADFAVLLIVATLAAFLARRTNQPPLVGYLLAGIVLGPVVTGWITETPFITLLADLGLGFLLFLIGIEMRFEELKGIFAPVTRIALGQTVLQTALAFAVSLALGFILQEALVLAVATVFGATPVVVKLLADQDKLSTLPGKIDVGVLLIQDIILVITLTLLSIGSWSSTGTMLLTVVEILLLVAFIGGLAWLSSRYMLPRIFDQIAENSHAFFIYGIAWAFLFIVGAEYLGISIEVGAFLAGLSLGQLPYSEEMAERVRPLTELFMVVFFTTIGLTLSADNLFVYWKEAIIASAVLMVGNFLIMFYLIHRERFSPETSFKGSITLTQVSEFSLVVGAVAVANGLIHGAIVGYLSLMAIITMGVSAYFINESEKLYQWAEPLLERFASDEHRDVEITSLRDHAVIIGYNKIAQAALPVVKQHFEEVIIVDRDPQTARDAPDEHVIYGDIRHGEIRKAARLKKAACIISVANDHTLNLKILEDRRRDAVCIVRESDLEDAAELLDLGADYVINEKLLAVDELMETIETHLNEAGETQ